MIQLGATGQIWNRGYKDSGVRQDFDTEGKCRIIQRLSPPNGVIKGATMVIHPYRHTKGPE